MRSILFSILFIAINCEAWAQAVSPRLEYRGVAIEAPGYHAWGTSPVRGEDGKVHVFVAQWPEDEFGDFRGWFHSSRIVHYVSDSPEGPFKRLGVVVEDMDGNFNSPSNPTIIKIDDKFVLSFIVNEDNDLSTQRIVMWIADSVTGPWRPIRYSEQDGTVLRKSKDPDHWNSQALLGVSNPSLIKFKKQYMLYFKSVLPHPDDPGKKGKYAYGVAVSNNLEGPYHQLAEPVTSLEIELEDAYAFTDEQSKVYLLSRDYQGAFGYRGGGLLWESEDGISFPANKVKKGFGSLASYVEPRAMEGVVVSRGSKEGHLERPQILFGEKGPEYIYFAAGVNISGGVGSCSFVFKIKDNWISKTDKESGKRPNVIFILADDQGYGDFPTYGNEYLDTPNIDTLYRESVRLNRFYVSPVCAPARASFMTGRYNQRTGVWDTWKGRVNLHKDEYTVAEALRDAGYATGIFGKWHLGYNVPLRPQDQGFEMSILWDEYAKDTETRIDPVILRNGKIEYRNGFLDDILFDEAIGWIESRSREKKPFFVFMSSFLPHTCDDPQVPQRYVDAFAENDELVQHTKEVYGMLEKLDENIGRLLQRVKDLGIEDDTVIIYTSDNGPQMNSANNDRQQRFNAGLRGSKGNVFEGGIKVPCFFRWPERWEAGREIDGITAHIDLMPTLLELCGAEVELPNPVDGISLLPVIEGRSELPSERVFFQQFQRAAVPELWANTVMVEDRFKLVNGEQLYDLQDDPKESNDISGQYPEKVQRMREATEQWFADVSSSRGYVTSYTEIGNPAQNVTTLQFFNRNENGWPLRILQRGPFRVTVENVTPELFPEGADLCIQFGDTVFRQAIKPGDREIVFDSVYVPTGFHSFQISTDGYKLPKVGRWNMEDLGYRNVKIEMQ